MLFSKFWGNPNKYICLNTRSISYNLSKMPMICRFELILDYYCKILSKITSYDVRCEWPNRALTRFQFQTEAQSITQQA